MTNDAAHNFVRDLDSDNELERGLPCFVHHEDAGGQCEHTATMRVYGLAFCEEHGEDVKLGAISEAAHEAYNFFQRFKNPHVEGLGPLVDREIDAAVDRVMEERPSGTEEVAAMMRAFPDAPEHVRSRVVAWELDEEPYEAPVYDSLQDSLYTVHKVMQVAYADGETWLVEMLELQRESVAAQAAYALRERREKRDGLRPVG
ncbi:MAG: hypothetical protein M3Q49_06520 [Actinomycetota bacterium]|nr:hypothetical protein [Actinomycetota bacterium]